MKVYVIMGNDYPAAACATEEGAEKYIAKKNQEEEERKKKDPNAYRRIYWRAYEFEVLP